MTTLSELLRRYDFCGQINRRFRPKANSGHNLHPLSPPPCPAPILRPLHPTKGAVARHRAAGCGGGFREASPSRTGAPGGRAFRSPLVRDERPRSPKHPRAEPGGARSALHRHLDIDTRHRHAARTRATRLRASPFRGAFMRNPAALGRPGLLVRLLGSLGTTPVILGGRRSTGIHHRALSSPRMDPGLRRVPRLVQDDGFKETGPIHRKRDVVPGATQRRPGTHSGTSIGKAPEWIPDRRGCAACPG